VYFYKISRHDLGTIFGEQSRHKLIRISTVQDIKLSREISNALCHENRTILES